MSDVCYLSIAQLGRAYATRELSPLEVTKAFLRRIGQLDSWLHSYVTVTSEGALSAAKASERRYARRRGLGPLDGIPLGLKDLFDTAGVRTTAHSRVTADRVPKTDATVVKRLVAAGAVILGKQAMHEFALGKSDDPGGLFPLAHNPWNLQRISGGSSSGSAAAVAAGLCAGAIASDTGGSIRIPASYCGVVGFKPTYGLVSRVGMIPLSWTLDHAGPIARTTEDAALLMQVLAGHDPADPANAPIAMPNCVSKLGARVAGLRVGTPRALIEQSPDIEADVLGAYRAALVELVQLGATLEDVDLSSILEHSFVAWKTMMLTEALTYHERDARERADLFGRTVYRRLLEAALITGADYVQAVRGRAVIGRAVNRVMNSIDVLVVPTLLRTAWPVAEDDDRIPLRVRIFFTYLFNVTGQPAITIPCGISAEGMPIGLQVAARPFEDCVALSVAHAFERATGWSAQRPRLEEQVS